MTEVKTRSSIEAGAPAFYALLDAANATVKLVDTRIGQVVKPNWLGTTCARLLLMVSAHEGATPSEIARNLVQETHSVSGLLNRLEDANPSLIRRSRDRQDRRVVHVHLTGDGQRVAALVRPIFAEVGTMIAKDAETSRDGLEALLDIHKDAIGVVRGMAGTRTVAGQRPS